MVNGTTPTKSAAMLFKDDDNEIDMMECIMAQIVCRLSLKDDGRHI